MRTIILIALFALSANTHAQWDYNLDTSGGTPYGLYEALGYYSGKKLVTGTLPTEFLFGIGKTQAVFHKGKEGMNIYEFSYSTNEGLLYYTSISGPDQLVIDSNGTILAVLRPDVSLVFGIKIITGEEFINIISK